MKRNLLLAFFGVALCFGAMTSAAQAQATRTWVSGLGDDANPCSRTAPCKTFPGAYSRTAVGGEIDVIDPGGFGNITIGHAITIDGGGGLMASILASSSTTGVVVNAGPTDQVTLRNINIQGVSQSPFPGANGIVFNSGLVLNVEHCIIENFATNGINFQPTARAFLNVIDTTIENAGGDGVIISTAASGGGLNRVAMTDTRIINNGGNGVKVLNNSRVSLYRTMLNRNGTSAGDGVLVNGSSILGLDDSLVSNSGGSGLHTQTGGSIRSSNSSIVDNGAFGVFTDTGTIFSGLNNRVKGNTSGDGTFTGPIPLS